jgi:acyl-CoA synthetase (NDP forming)
MNAVTELVQPGAVAVIGASERSSWFRALHRNILRFSSPDLYLVNPRGEPVLGERTYRSVAEIGATVRLACVLVRAERVSPVLREVAERGIRNVVVIASGFQEAGETGQQRTAELRAIAGKYELNVLGPNTSGFINVREGFTPFGSSLQPPLLKGTVGVVSQSGALAGQITRLAQRRGVGLSVVLGTGNEAVITASDGLEYFVHDDDTSVIAMFLEDVKEPAKFQAAAHEALRRGKPIIALKVGRTAAGQRAALSHTGAVAGNDAVIDAAFAKYGVIRVETLDEMVAVAGLLAQHRDITGRRIGAIAPSGGFCDIIADAASDDGLDLPELSAATTAGLRQALPDYGTAKNPLDLTGNVVSDRSAGLRALRCLADDPHLDAVVYTNPVPFSSGAPVVEAVLTELASITAQSRIPIVLQEGLSVDFPPENHELLARHGLAMSIGLELTLRSLSSAAWWSERNRRGISDYEAPSGGNAGDTRTLNEVLAREVLASGGVAVPPGDVADDADAAARIADSIGYPVVVKGVSDTLLHKTDIGAVRLDLRNAQEVRAAAEDVLSISEPAGRIERVLITAMRPAGTELLVSVTAHPGWGQMLTVGLGGIWVEIMKDTASRLLPVSDSDIVEMLEGLRGAAMLREDRRDRNGVDVRVVASMVGRVAALATTMGPALDTMELNPLWARGDQVEALDALLIVRDDVAESGPRGAGPHSF